MKLKILFVVALIFLPLLTCSVEGSGTDLKSSVVFIENIDDLKVEVSDFGLIGFSQEVIRDLTSEDYQVTKDIITSGNLVVVEGDATQLSCLGMPIICNPNSTYSAIKYDNGIMHYFSTNCTEAKLQEKLNSWQSSISTSSSDIPTATFTESDEWDEGSLTVTNRYYYLGEQFGYKYYGVRQTLQAQSVSGWKTADLISECKVDKLNNLMNLVESSPADTYEMKSVTYSVNLSIGGLDAGISWQCETPPVLIHNESNNADDFYKIWFDVDEDTVRDHATVEPGFMAKVSTSSMFQTEETMTVQFEGPYNGIWPWDPKTQIKSHTLTVHAILV